MDKTEIQKLMNLLAVTDEAKLEKLLQALFNLPQDVGRERLYAAITKEAGTETTLFVLSKLDPARHQIVEKIRSLENAREVGKRHPLQGMAGGPQGPEAGTGANRWLVQRENDVKNSIQAKIESAMFNAEGEAFKIMFASSVKLVGRSDGTFFAVEVASFGSPGRGYQQWGTTNIWRRECLSIGEAVEACRVALVNEQAVAKEKEHAGPKSALGPGFYGATDLVNVSGKTQFLGEGEYVTREERDARLAKAEKEQQPDLAKQLEALLRRYSRR